MEYKKYLGSSFNVYTIKTDRFKTSHLEVVFHDYADQDTIGAYSFLADILSDSCHKYPKKKDLITRFEELYKIVIYAQTVRVGNIISLHVSLDFINPEYINDPKYLEEVLKTLFEIIDNPNVVNDEFSLKSFNIIKERIKREILSLKENPIKQSIKESFKLMDESTPTSYELLGTLESLEKITPESLYKTYKNLRKNFKVDIFLIGNLDMDKTVSLIKENFKNRYIVDKSFDLVVKNKLTKKVKYKEIPSENVQANVAMLFNLDALTELEKNITMLAFNYLFGSGGLNAKLYKSIREENSLCYTINSMYLKYDSLLLVQISLDNKNVKQAIDLVKKELVKMQKGLFTDTELEETISNMLVSLDMTLDNNVAILNNYIFNIYDNLPLIPERMELFKKLTKEDIINVAKKIKLNSILNLKGEE